MATWVRTGSTLTGSANSDVTGTIELGNGTAPADFDPDAVNSVRIQFTEEYASGTFDNDTFSAHQAADLTLDGAGSVLASVDATDQTINDSADTFPVDLTDSTIPTGFTTAQWEGAELNPGDASGVWVTFDQNMGPDGVAVRVTSITVTIDYTPSAADQTLTGTLYNPGSTYPVGVVSIPVVVEQAAYRFRHATGKSETGEEWRAAVDTAIAMEDAGHPFRLRLLLQVSGSDLPATTDIKLQYRLNTGAWTDVTTGSSVVRPTTSGGAPDKGATTQQLGSGTFTAGEIVAGTEAVAEDIGVTAGQETELEWVLTLIGAGITATDTIEFRTQYDTGSGYVTADTVTVTPTITVTAPDMTQDGFRWRNDDGDETSATWRAALNTDITPDGSVETFRLRWSILNSGGGSSDFDDWEIHVSKNGGGYAAIGSGDWEFVASPNVADAEVTTQQISSGKFRVGEIREAAGLVSWTNWGHSDVARMELEGVFAPKAALTAGDVYDFRVYRNGVALDAYTQTPRVTVSAGNQTLTGTLYNPAAVYPVGTVTPGGITVTGTLYNPAAVYPAGTVTPGPVTVTGSLYNPTAVYPAGTVTPSVTLTGTLYNPASTYPAGIVTPGSVTVTGSLYTAGSVYPVGTATAGATNLTGTLYTSTAVYPTGTVTPGAVTVTGTLYSPAATYPDGVVSPGSVTLNGTLYNPAAVYPTGTAQTGAVTVNGTLYNPTSVYPVGTVTAGSVELTGSLYSPGSSYPDGTATAGASILTGTLHNPASTYPTGAVTPGPVTVTGTLYSPAAVYPAGAVTVDSGNQTLTGTLYNPAAVYPAGTVTPGGITVTGALYNPTAVYPDGTVTSTVALTGTLYTSTSTYPTGTVTPGPVTLNGTLYNPVSVYLSGRVTTDGAWWTPNPIPHTPNPTPYTPDPVGYVKVTRTTPAPWN